MHKDHIIPTAVPICVHAVYKNNEIAAYIFTGDPCVLPKPRGQAPVRTHSNPHTLTNSCGVMKGSESGSYLELLDQRMKERYASQTLEMSSFDVCSSSMDSVTPPAHTSSLSRINNTRTLTYQCVRAHDLHTLICTYFLEYVSLLHDT